MVIFDWRVILRKIYKNITSFRMLKKTAISFWIGVMLFKFVTVIVHKQTAISTFIFYFLILGRLWFPSL